MSNARPDVPGGVSIGQAAALFGLAPSTLRWWEARRVLPEPPRVNGCRVYSETGLRQIGLAYLCCVVGEMPLDQAAVVVSGGGDRDWREAVLRHAASIEATMRRLRSARGYLLHLSQCPDEDIVEQCSDLDDELLRHTPRRLVTRHGLVEAAAALAPGGPPRSRRDETTAARDETDPATDCAWCARPLSQTGRGRRRRYCSRACRQKAHRARAAGGVGRGEPGRSDATVGDQ